VIHSFLFLKLRHTCKNKKRTAGTLSINNTKAFDDKGKGPSIKYVTLEGEGVREGVTV